jgi:hypothetical protein
VDVKLKVSSQHEKYNIQQAIAFEKIQAHLEVANKIQISTSREN